MKTQAYFPATLWDGLVRSRLNLTDDQHANHYDADRIIAEILAIQNHLKNTLVTLLFVTSPPSDSLGEAGNFALDYDNLVLYGPKTSTWGSGSPLTGGGPHAASHAAGGGDPLTLTIAQITGLQAALDAISTYPQIQATHSYGDATPAVLGIVPANLAILRVEINVIVPFNGTNPSLRVGISGGVDDLMLATENDPTTIATYASHPNIEYGSDKQILLSITPGAGATQGRVVVSVTYKRT